MKRSDFIFYFAKTNPNATIPDKKKENAGYDIYACFEQEHILIPSFKSMLIPTGIATAFSNKYVLLLEERGSTGTKNLKRNAGVIDSGYRGEIFACLYNGNRKPIIISKVKKPLALPDNDYILYDYKKAICQGLLLKLGDEIPEEKTYQELLKIKSSRNLGKLGSSNK